MESHIYRIICENIFNFNHDKSTTVQAIKKVILKMRMAITKFFSHA